MIDRKNYINSVICAVIDYTDVPAIAVLFPDDERRTQVLNNAKQFCKDRRPIVASLIFDEKGYSYLDFSFRYGSLTPGDNGEVTYFENWIEETEEGFDNNGMESYAIAEQVCFRSFIRMIEIADKDRLKL